ncbi:MAG: hypothetical protein QM736_03540 [Vicinamibacterales bacterium]
MSADDDDYARPRSAHRSTGVTAHGARQAMPGATRSPAHQHGFQQLLPRPGVRSRRSASWDQIMVQPGETVFSLLTFVVRRTSRAAAKASLERLVQLPPEALEGLTVDDRTQIVNFVIPADGQKARWHRSAASPER